MENLGGIITFAIFFVSVEFIHDYIIRRLPNARPWRLKVIKFSKYSILFFGVALVLSGAIDFIDKKMRCVSQQPEKLSHAYEMSGLTALEKQKRELGNRKLCQYLAKVCPIETSEFDEAIEKTCRKYW